MNLINNMKKIKKTFEAAKAAKEIAREVEEAVVSEVMEMAGEIASEVAEAVVSEVAYKEVVSEVAYKEVVKIAEAVVYKELIKIVTAYKEVIGA